MERYGIIDVGSNTMVLIVYEMEDGRPVPVDYLSTPVHLVDS